MTLEVSMVPEGAWWSSGWSRRARPILTWWTIARRSRATWRRHRQRHELSELDDRLLRGIGVTRDAAREGARKRYWR